MMMFRVLRGLTMDDVYFAPGETIEGLPESRAWLIEIGAVEQVEAEPKPAKKTKGGK
jgi:hypothetical protein